MRFRGDESGADDQERILEASLVQNWWFIKARGQDGWAERAAAAADYIPWGWGKVRKKGG